MRTFEQKIPSLWPEALIALFAVLLQQTGLFDLTIKNATPFYLLPITVAVAMFYGETRGLAFGFCAGMLADSVAVQSTVYNMVFLSIVGFAVGIMAEHIFNKNLPAAGTLSLITSALYFGIIWIFDLLLPDVLGKIYYLLNVSVPSAVYTSLFILPMYYFEKRRFIKKKGEK